ncbi:MAG: right-handed parallel beta-helix repeat-containing protein [Candidatus Binatia bacterium]
MRPSARLLLLGSVMIGVAAGAAHAANELCGQTITQSLTFTADQSCTGDGLIVVGDGITIDLGGFTLSGDGGASDDGIDVSAVGHVVIKNGTIRNFAVGITSLASAPELVKVSKVTLRDNDVSGLRVTAGLLVVDKCSATNNQSGLDARGEAVKITATSAIGNLGPGIILSAETVTVTKVLVIGNGGLGLVLGLGGSKVAIKSSQFVRNGSDGVRINEATFRPGKIVIAKNRIIGNGGRGVLTGGGDDVNRIVPITITGNLIAGNAGGGVRLNSEADDTVVTGNRIVGNGNDAVSIDATSDGALVKGNAIAGNNGAGITTENASATLAKNAITANDNAILAPVGAIDGGGNKARANVDQSCSASITCPPTFTPKPSPVTPTCGMHVTASIQLGADTPVCSGTDGIIVDSDNVTIDLNGHEVRGDGTAGKSGIRTAPFLQHITIANGIVRGFSTGITAAVGDLEIRNVEVRDNGNGGAALAGGEMVIDKSAFVNNGGSGLELTQSSNPPAKIKASVFYGNESDGLRVNDASAVLTNVVAAVNGGVGVRFVTAGTGQLAKSLVAANTGDGVRLDDAFGALAPVILKKNEVVGNGANGILLAASAVGAILDGNLAGGNGGRGIALMSNPAATTLAKNDLVGNATDGLFVDVIVQATTVVQNRAVGNGGSGLNVDIAAATLTKNVAVGNQLNGIRTPFGAIDGGGNTARDNLADPQCEAPISCP